jgi:putative endonuclease
VFWVYILLCSDGSYYTGHTDNLEARIGAHCDGTLGGYTHTRRPLQLVWSESLSTRYEALAAERQIKGWSRRKKQALIDGKWNLISELARRRGGRAAR